MDEYAHTSKHGHGHLFGPTFRPIRVRIHSRTYPRTSNTQQARVTSALRGYRRGTRDIAPEECLSGHCREIPPGRSSGQTTTHCVRMGALEMAGSQRIGPFSTWEKKPSVQLPSVCKTLYSYNAFFWDKSCGETRLPAVKVRFTNLMVVRRSLRLQELDRDLELEKSGQNMNTDTLEKNTTLVANPKINGCFATLCTKPVREIGCAPEWELVTLILF